MENNKKIRVHYFFIKVLDIEKDNGEKADSGELENLLNSLLYENVMDRMLKSDSSRNEIRLQTLQKEENYWKMQFVKVRDSIIPSKVNSSGDFNTIELGDDEYIGEDVACLYYPKKHVIAIQRNFYSASSKNICEYFNQISRVKFQHKYIYLFEPIIDSSVKNLDYHSIVALDFSCSDLNNPDLNDVILNKEGLFGAQSLCIHIAVKNTKKNPNTLSKQGVTQFIKKVMGINTTRKLKAKVQIDEASPLSEIDFLEQRIETSFSLTYSKQNPITYSRVIKKMIMDCLKDLDKI